MPSTMTADFGSAGSLLSAVSLFSFVVLSLVLLCVMLGLCADSCDFCVCVMNEVCVSNDSAYRFAVLLC
jgi:hypothetical protein